MYISSNTFFFSLASYKAKLAKIGSTSNSNFNWRHLTRILWEKGSVGSGAIPISCHSSSGEVGGV